jgi:hypothetical protein
VASITMNLSARQVDSIMGRGFRYPHGGRRCMARDA